jgi:acetylornithine deacetylase/succinyl-diaminopimelate desuccinylase-like protein
MRRAAEAAKLARTWTDGPVRGWDSSCDARIFACQYPGLPVLTCGPGLLAHAHGDQEQIDIDDMVKSAEFLAYFILKQTGTLE